MPGPRLHPRRLRQGEVPAPGGDIQQLIRPAQPHHGAPVVIAEGNVGDRDALQINLQNGGVAQVPEGGGHHDLVRRGELAGRVKHGLVQPPGVPKRVPLRQDLGILGL